MDIESNFYSDWYDVLTLRNFNVDPFPDSNILICDTATDQCTVIRKAWHIEAFTNRFAGFSNYLDANNYATTQHCPLVSACTILCGPNLEPTMIRVNEGVLMENDNQAESLLHPY